MRHGSSFDDVLDHLPDVVWMACGATVFALVVGLALAFVLGRRSTPGDNGVATPRSGYSSGAFGNDTSRGAHAVDPSLANDLGTTQVWRPPDSPQNRF